MRKYFFLILALSYAVAGKAQQRFYIVQLTNKQGSSYSLNRPLDFLSSRAVQKRIRYNIPIDSTDLPCTAAYVSNIQSAGIVNVLYCSKWFNQVNILTDDDNAIAKIKSFPFVQYVKLIGSPSIGTESAKLLSPKKELSEQSLNEFYNYGQSFDQVNIHNGQFLHDHGFRGEGKQICITDGGFANYQTSPAFDSLKDNNQILATWDFVANDTSFADNFTTHGSYCFSIIGANMPGTFVGTAPKASFYLYRTEDAFSETPVEEQNWIAAAEQADSLGADVISCSLGYTTFDNPAFNHTYNDMNGNTTPISKAADLAAKKGMIVVVSAGNSGNDNWHFISAPADGDSVLTVGAVNKFGQVANFSSYGPSSDGQVKPDVASVGLNAIVVHSNGQPFANNGTSYACPNLAGLATCLWQAFPEVNNMSVINAIQQSSNKFNNPDNRTGYGIPDMKEAFVLLLKKLYTRQVSILGCKVDISFAVKSDTSATFFIERKLAGEDNYNVINTQEDAGAFSLKNFNYADDLGNAAIGLIKYRIKMQISADTTFYLDSASINFSGICQAENLEKITISPNPVVNNLNVLVTTNTPSEVEIAIQTATGQKVFYTKKHQAATTDQYSIPFFSMSRGIYFVTVYINGRKEKTVKILH